MKLRFTLAVACLIVTALAIIAIDAMQAKAMEGVTNMSLEQEKSLSRRSLEMWSSNNSDNPDDIFAKTYINHQEPDAKGGVKSLDLSEWKELVAENHRAFSDFSVRILMQIAEGDLVATRWQFSATQTGVYLGHSPTGKHVIWTGVQIDRFEHGKIVESWVDWDKYRLFKELAFVK